MEELVSELGGSKEPGTGVLNMLESLYASMDSLCDPLERKKGKAIHEMRRSFKKSRALLRMIRDSMGYASYFLENRSLRDMQRLLSPARDGDVILELLNRLRRDFPLLEGQSWYSGVLEGALVRRNAAWEALLEAQIPDLISRGMSQARERLPHYHFTGEGFELVEGGLERIYRQGRAMQEEAFRPDAEASTIHQFRKRAKYRQNQTAFLEPLSPAVLGPEFRSLQKLSDILGDYNDYNNALELLPGWAPGDAATLAELEVLELKLRRKMARLKEKAGNLSRSLYSEDPEQYLTRLRTCWLASVSA